MSIKQVAVPEVIITRTNENGDQIALYMDDDLMVFPGEGAAMQWMKAQGWSDEYIDQLKIMEVEKE